jgi:hypothetical protein
MSLVECYQLRLPRRPDKLLACKRRVANERLQRRFGASPQINDVRSEIFGIARSLEVGENGANPVQSGERRL